MVYIITETSTGASLFVVKADSRESFIDRVKLREGETVSAFLTDAQVNALRIQKDFCLPLPCWQYPE